MASLIQLSLGCGWDPLGPSLLNSPGSSCWEHSIGSEYSDSCRGALWREIPCTYQLMHEPGICGRMMRALFGDPALTSPGIIQAEVQYSLSLITFCSSQDRHWVSLAVSIVNTPLLLMISQPNTYTECTSLRTSLALWDFSKTLYATGFQRSLNYLL